MIITIAITIIIIVVVQMNIFIIIIMIVITAASYISGHTVARCYLIRCQISRTKAISSLTFVNKTSAQLAQ